MSIRLQMLTAAGRAKNILADSTQLVANFTAAQINQDGGFKGRTKDSDLYYTVFGIETLLYSPHDRILQFEEVRLNAPGAEQEFERRVSEA